MAEAVAMMIIALQEIDMEEVGKVTQAAEVMHTYVAVTVVEDKKEDFHPPRIGCTLLLVSHTVAQVVRLPAEVMGEADLKE